MYTFQFVSDFHDSHEFQFFDSLQVTLCEHGRPQGQKHRQGPVDKHEAHRRYQHRRWLGYFL